MLFSLQLLLDLYRELKSDERRRVDGALTGTGWSELLAYEPRHRLARQGFELVFEPS